MANTLITPKYEPSTFQNSVNIGTEISMIRYIIDKKLPKEHTNDTTYIKTDLDLLPAQLDIITDWEFHTFFDPRNSTPLHIATTSKSLDIHNQIATIKYLDYELIASDINGITIYLPDDILSLEGGTILWQRF